MLRAAGQVLPAGSGTVSGTGVTVTETGNDGVHKSTFTLTNLSVTMTDAGAAGCHGKQKIYTFPAGAIQFLGASYNLTTAAGAGGISDTAALIGALGSLTVGTDNETLSGTEADLIASTTGTLTAGAGTLAAYKGLIATPFDGTSTAMTAFLNLVVPNADSSASDTLTVNGTITMTWVNLGDL